MNALRGVGARLSLALLLVVAAALGIVYVALVPLVERNLVDAKVDQLVQSAGIFGPRVPESVEQWQIFVENVAPSVNARVLIVDVLPEADAAVVLPFADSQEVLGAQSPVVDELAVRALESLEPQGAQVGEGDNAYAEAAVAFGEGTFVLVLRAPLGDTLENVQLVRRRLLIAGFLALVFSLAVGYGAAYLFARRLRRLERAADRISSGRFDEPIEDAGHDEVGQLAAAFDRMRQRLAGLERARREFIANASHELRTPLFSLGGFLELLDVEELDERTRREFVATAREQVQRLTKLATDLLDLSRLDAGRVRLEHVPLDLGSVARSITEEFEAVAQARNHPIEMEVDGSPRGVGDEQRTIQIGRILLENALLHTPPGTRVRVSAAQENGRAVLAVEDAGPGIPTGQEEHVFERFYRVDGAVASGSGLGLAIARELAELMGGTIELESQPGSTTFRLALPSAA
jgi:two-component system OmpR family sensor kinase